MSRDCRATVVRRSCERVAAKFWRIYNAKISRLSYDCRTNAVRESCDSRTTFMRVSQLFRREILANLQCEHFATLIRLSHECRTIVAQQSSQLSGEKIKLSDIRTNVVRHSHECLATVVQMKTKLKLRSWERSETISLCLIKSIQRDCDVKVLLISLIFVAK